ncbi:MAG: hypothetical protein DRQ78_06595 [Epsilonproteobacteria bacterium]|nr:MAG: hypothetical protein DRQ78_06595 [Campylobacterota bacterium]
MSEGNSVVKKKDVIEHYPINVIPDLDSNLNVDNVLSLVPAGYSHIVESTFDESTDSLDLFFSNAEKNNENVRIPARLFMPSERRNIFPKFVLEVSSLLGKQFDYNKYPHYILNQNQFLYAVILHRLMQFDGQNTPWVHLLRRDVTAIVSYGEYDSYSSYNAKKKSQNYIALVSPWTLTHKKDPDGTEYDSLQIKFPLGEFVSNDSKRVSINNNLLSSVFRDLPIQPASESMAAENAKFVMYPHGLEFYRCAGYTTTNITHLNKSVPVIRTIYPRMPNIPSRLKTHIISDCYNFQNSDMPIFKEDIYSKATGDLDRTIKNAFVVFDDMNDATGRFVCGEIEASRKFSSNVIYKDEVIRERFEMIVVKEGENVIKTDNRFIIGMNDEDEEIALYNFNSVEIISIEDSGYGSSYKIIARCSKKIGSSKALSTTGLKGMTKPKPRLGSVQVLDKDMEPILDTNGNPFIKDVDLITGMNGVKAKANTIFLARAALASNLGISKKTILSTMNEKQINKEAKKIGKCLWIDNDGNEKLVWFGVVQVRINELSYMFNNVKKQKFMAESGRYLRNGGYKKVFKKIWKLGVDPDMKELVLELQKILMDYKAHYHKKDDIPIITPDQLLYGKGPNKVKMFELEDCQTDMQPTFEYTDNKMLDEEWNRGWYLDLRPLNKTLGLVRMPSAKLINTLTSELPDGRWSYPVIFKMVSNIVEICLTVKDNGYRDLPFLVDIKKGDRNYNPTQKHIARYLSMIHSMIYKNKDLVMSHNKLINVFMKPELFGVGMKQMSESRVPQGTGVIIDVRAYKKMLEKTGGFFDKHEYYNALCVRNPVVWQSQVQSIKIIGIEIFEMQLALEHNVILKDYLCLEFCREILLMNPEDILVQQSDCDGDLMPVFVIDNYKCQKLIEQIRLYNSGNSSCGGLNGILPEEIEWLNSYRMDELSSNKELDLSGKKYCLYDIPISNNPIDNQPTFLKYFRDTIVAKTEVGSATIQLWAINTLLEVYQYLCEEGQILDNRGNKVVMSDYSCRFIVYTYTRLIQDFVVRGIKHVDGGSSGFEPFKLEKISVKMTPSVRKYFKDTIKMPNNTIRDFERMLHWMKNKKYLQSVTKFIAMFNSGKDIINVNPEHLRTIENNSFYGFLLRDMRKIRDEVAGLVRDDFAEIDTDDEYDIGDDIEGLDDLLG